MEPVARRPHRLVEPIHLVTYSPDEPTAALMALATRNYWDGYFAGRAAPLGRVLAGAYRRDGVPAGALVGLPVSGGIIEGRAHVILDMAQADLEPGEILVEISP